MPSNTLKQMLRQLSPGLTRRLRTRFGYPALARKVLRSSSRGANYVVADGPLSGLLLAGDTTGAIIAKVLGTYELELRKVVDEIVQHSYATVINVGCGEGYYLVGLARKMNNTQFIGFDVDPAAQALAANHAELNCVADRVSVRGACDHAVLNAMDLRGTLLLIDCEGYEDVLLDPQKVDGLRHCDLLVELHDLFVPGLTDRLRDRFRATHRLTLIEEVSRKPSDLPSPFHRWQSISDRLMSEHRPGKMNWGLWQTNNSTN